MLKFIAPKRGVDKQGSGEFGAPRGSRTHRGIDYAAHPGSLLITPVTGIVSKLGWCYSKPELSEFRYVQITDHKDFRHRFFYIQPSVAIGIEVFAGIDTLGSVQTLPFEGITQHAHYEIKTSVGEYINPEEWWGFI